MSSKALPTLSSGELAKLLGVSRTSIHDNLDKGLLTRPSTTLGGHLRFDVDTVIADYKSADKLVPPALVDFKRKHRQAVGASS